MIRALLVGLIALAASANAFVALVPAVPRVARSAARVQMVTSPRVSSPPSSKIDLTQSQEKEYATHLQKMEKEAMVDLEKTFDEIAAKAKAESETIWNDLEKEFEDVVVDDD